MKRTFPPVVTELRLIQDEAAHMSDSRQSQTGGQLKAEKGQLEQYRFQTLTMDCDRETCGPIVEHDVLNGDPAMDDSIAHQPPTGQ
jgi:hypothetical protein